MLKRCPQCGQGYEGIHNCIDDSMRKEEISEDMVRIIIDCLDWGDSGGGYINIDNTIRNFKNRHLRKEPDYLETARELKKQGNDLNIHVSYADKREYYIKSFEYYEKAIEQLKENK